MSGTLVECRYKTAHNLSCAIITTVQCIGRQQLQYNVNYLTACCCKGVSRGSLCNGGSSLPWDGGVGSCCLSTAHNTLCSRGWKGRHILSSSYRGMLGGGDGGRRGVGLLVRHRCSSLHRDTSLAPCLKAGLNRATDSQSNSATLLKAMQTQLKCDNTPATHGTLHVMLFVSHARAYGVDFGQHGLVSDLATLHPCVNNL